MPTYEYKCESCTYRFDKFHSMTFNEAVKCPNCGNKADKMISGGAGLIFKGTGFYQTDYKNKGE